MDDIKRVRGEGKGRGMISHKQQRKEKGGTYSLLSSWRGEEEGGFS